jgi:putative endonuclease
MFYVYLIRNQKTGGMYIGYTENLRRRIAQHKEKNPDLVYYEAYKSENDARRRERMLKQRGQSVRRLKERLIDSLKI